MTRRHCPATVDHLADIAVELAVRIRDEDPAFNAVWLTHKLPDPRDWFRLAFVLAAGVPVDRPWRELTAWVDDAPAKLSTAVLREVPDVPAVKRKLQGCGTPAGAKRHLRSGEKPCEPCRKAKNHYNRTRQFLPVEGVAA